MIRWTVFGTITIAIGTAAMGFCSWGETRGSVPNTEQTSRELQPSIRVEVSGWKVTEETSEAKAILAKLL